MHNTKPFNKTTNLIWLVESCVYYYRAFVTAEEASLQTAEETLYGLLFHISLFSKNAVNEHLTVKVETPCTTSKHNQIIIQFPTNLNPYKWI